MLFILLPTSGVTNSILSFNAIGFNPVFILEPFIMLLNFFFATLKKNYTVQQDLTNVYILVTINLIKINNFSIVHQGFFKNWANSFLNML